MSKPERKRITLRELRENPERFQGILQTAQTFKPVVVRFLAAKKEAERVFENLRHADMDEAAAYLRKHPMTPEGIAALIHVAHRALTLEKSRAAISTRLAKDPKQAVMRETYKLWQEWREGKAIYRSAAAFARAMVAKYPVIENPITVQRWVTAWSRGSAVK